MSQEAFLRHVLECPADNTTRLVYADWLDENDDSDRAEFIRLQCYLYPYQNEREWLENMPSSSWRGPADTGDLLTRIAPMVKRHLELARLNAKDCTKWSREFIKYVLGDNYLQTSAPWYWGWSRGFVSHVSFPVSDCTDNHLKRIFSVQPVEHVQLYGVVRGGVVFRTSNNHADDIPRELWANLRLPSCTVNGDCRRGGTHAHMTEETLSEYIVAYGRRLAGLPDLPQCSQNLVD